MVNNALCCLLGSITLFHMKVRMMKIFFLKSIFLVALMFFSVLFGMQQANIGIQKMKGYEDPEFKSALSIQSSDEGKLEASVLGVDVSSHDLATKKRKLEELKAYNLFSDLGKKLTYVISSGLKGIMSLFAE
jgi:hypothetical protein